MRVLQGHCVGLKNLFRVEKCDIMKMRFWKEQDENCLLKLSWLDQVSGEI